MSASSKNVLPLFMYITRIGEKYHVAMDGKVGDLQEFGVEDEFKSMVDTIEKAVQDFFENKKIK